VHDDFLVRIGGKLLDRPKPIEGAELLVPDWLPDVPFNEPPVPAAVLIALVARPGGHSLLFTQRSLGLRAHSGQVSFPGGKIDEADTDAGAAALREANEEVGLNPKNATILGYMAPYQTGTNYVITPVVAVVEQDEAFVANPKEVDEVFEMPLAFAARAQNYSRFVVRRENVELSTWQLDYGGYMIWGITANLTRLFRDLALKELDI